MKMLLVAFALGVIVGRVVAQFTFRRTADETVHLTEARLRNIFNEEARHGIE